MLYTKDDYPEINEIVKCTVTKIYGNTVFVSVDEYEKEGVLTISEIAPGRIRNLRDHVSENRVIICKVLRVDAKQNRIDVSLRRVSIPAKKTKQDELKREEYAERVYGDIAKELNITTDDLFEKTYEPIFEEYTLVFDALYDIMLNNEKIEIFSELSKEEKEVFLKGINDKIKPEEVTLKKKFKLFSKNSNGVEVLIQTLDEVVKELNYDKLSIVYLAAGEYEIKIVHEDMKSADKLYNKFLNFFENKKTKDFKFESL